MIKREEFAVSLRTKKKSEILEQKRMKTIESMSLLTNSS